MPTPLRISEQYAEQNRQLHALRDDYGAGGARHKHTVLQTAMLLGARTVLDYGCGKATLSRAIDTLDVRNYDPCLSEYSERPAAADMVVCTDVLEHVEPEHVDDVIADIKELAKLGAVFVVATVPAAKTLPDGRNAHLTVRPAEWWQAKIGTCFDLLDVSAGDTGVQIIASVNNAGITDEGKRYKEAHPDRKILAVAGSCIVGDDLLLEQARVAMKIGYPEVTKPQDPYFTTPLVIVGAGLSALPYLDEIREKAKTLPVLALKGAHNWLIDNGIIPTFACALDPQQSRARCFKNPRDDVIYLLASTVHPDTWLHLSGKRVMLFHQLFTQRQRELPEWQDKTLLTGGCSTGTRAMPLMYFCGFRHFQLYGYDSCVSRDDRIYKLEDVHVKGDAEVFPVYVGEREFWTTTSLYAQVQDLRGVLASMPGCTVDAYGDGIFQEVLRQGKAAGWPV